MHSYYVYAEYKNRHQCPCTMNRVIEVEHKVLDQSTYEKLKLAIIEKYIDFKMQPYELIITSMSYLGSDEDN